MQRKGLRTLQGALFGLFAAPGWALLHCLLDPRLRLADDLSSHAGLYAYLAVGGMVGFAVFGALLGHHEDALLDANRRLDELAVTDPLTGLKAFVVANALGDGACRIGFYSYGEIAGAPGVARDMHNMTLALTTFRES